MAVDPVPWFIQAPAEHSAEVARTLAYQAIGGKEGIARAGDLTVQPLPVPGGAVQVLPGAAGILNRGSGGAGQAYIGRVATAETVNIAATGSGSGRSDLIVFRVNDPQYGGSAPDSEVNGPYIGLDVISGVNSNVTRVQDVAGHEYDSAITLARVDLPASTGTVTGAMITKLAKVANPKREEVVFARPRIAADSNDRYLSATWQSGGEYFPGGAGDPNEFQVDIPEWATVMVVDSRWNSVSYNASRNPSARFWMEFGDEYRNHTWPENRQWEFATQQFSFGSVKSGASTDGAVANWNLMDTRTIPAKLRGKRVTFVFKAGRHASESTSNAIWMDSLGGLGCRLTFAEEAVDANIL